MTSSINRTIDMAIFSEQSVDNTLCSFLLNNDTKILTTDEIKVNVEKVLLHVFKNNNIKTKVDIFNNRINFSCPYCLDSSIHTHKKRGNIYISNKWYKCFNCFKTIPLYKLFQDFNNILSMSDIDIMLLKNYTQSIQKNSNSYELFDKATLMKYSLKRNIFREKLDFIPIKNTPAEKYLKSRYLNFIDIFDYSPKYNSLVIYNMDDKQNVIGMTTRSLNKNSQTKYLSYKLTKIYDIMKLEYDEGIEQLNSLSTIFNILRLDLNNTITIFEGPIDSLFYKNSVALSGITKHLPFEIDNVKYWLDNDDIGNKKSKQLYNANQSIFLWKKLLNDINIYNIKDLNELIVYSKKHNISLPNFDDYFSKDLYDVYWI